MNKTDAMDEILIRYQEGTLGQEERMEVERLIATDPVWKAAYRLHESMESALRDSQDQEILQQLEGLWDRSHKRTRTRYYAWAAGFLLLVGSGILLWYYFVFQPSASQLYQHYYAVAAIPDVYREKGQASMVQRNKAFEDYSLKKYDQALRMFDMLLQRDSVNTAVLFYAGICCMEEQKFETAILYFNKIIKREDPAYEEAACWYAGLSSLKLGKAEACKYLMGRLIARKGYYSDKAKEIISKL